IDDLYNFTFVADPNISPDGRRVTWVATTVDREGNGYRSSIWLAPSDGSDDPYRFTGGKGKDSSPRWSPDGTHIAFLSDRSGKNQVWIIPSDGGEAWQITDGPNSASEIGWMPDGRSIFYTTKLDPEQTEEEKAARKSDTRVITTLKYKFDGEGFLDNKRRHVHLASIDGGEPRAITSGDFDCTQPAISSDGHYLACMSNRTENAANNSLSDIWVTKLHNNESRRVTPEDGNYSTPSWSPSGTLAYVGHPVVEPYGPTTLDNLFTWDPNSDEISGLLVGIDREPGNSAIADARYGVPNQLPVWSADGSRVYTLLSDRGSSHVYSCPTSGNPEPLASGERDIQSFTVANDGTIAFASSTMQLPTEVFVRHTNGNDTRLSKHNDTFTDGIELGAVEEITYESDPGVEVHGWLLRPPGFNPNAKYPAIVQIHGGPHGMYGVGFFHEMHVLAACGYVVLYTNPRGSTGYGQNFVAASMNDWGGADYRDIMAGVPFLESLGYVDTARLGVTGGSYGGYLTNWIIGQTDQFKAAVTMRSTCNRLSLYGTSDFNMMYNDWEYAGTPYDNPGFYLERSPLTYVKNVTTPVLILHSEDDLRCPITQGEEFFVALKKLGKEVEFVRFPDESHNLSRAGQPVHRIERLERLTGWFDTHL
ncbi:MAG: S9 family peptidase, partial [Chloroflexota bacterium]|nr:S9 family peptidase [Chloroflexota bacterium]